MGEAAAGGIMALLWGNDICDDVTDVGDINRSLESVH